MAGPLSATVVLLAIMFLTPLLSYDVIWCDFKDVFWTRSMVVLTPWLYSVILLRDFSSLGHGITSTEQVKMGPLHDYAI